MDVVVRTKDVDLVVTVSQSRVLNVAPTCPVVFSSTLDFVQPLEMIGLPDIPSTTFGGYQKEQKLCITVTRKGSSPAVASNKRACKEASGYVQEQKEKNKPGAGGRWVNQRKS